MARPYWSGQVQISLVSFAINLFPATEAKADFHFHEINRKTGERIRHEKVTQSAAESGDLDAKDVIPKDEIVKGYEYEKGKYVTIEPDELSHLRLPSRRTIDVSQFVGADELSPEYVEKPYFVVPQDPKEAEAFATVRQGLINTKKCAIGKLTVSGREHIFAILPSDEGGMMGFTLRFEAELRKQEDYFHDIRAQKINDDSLQLAEDLIKKRTAKLDLSKFKDGYEAAVKELVEAKLKNLPIPRDEEPKPQKGKVINLFDALRKSLDDKKSNATSAKKSATKRPSASKRAVATKEAKRKSA